MAICMLKITFPRAAGVVSPGTISPGCEIGLLIALVYLDSWYLAARKFRPEIDCRGTLGNITSRD